MQVVLIVLAGVILSGCTTVATGKFDSSAIAEPKKKEIMERKGNLVQLSGESKNTRPVLVLLHGATDDPSEMMEIARQWKNEYAVFLFSYNYHEPVRKLALQFTREMQRLKTENRGLPGARIGKRLQLHLARVGEVTEGLLVPLEERAIFH